MLGLMADDKLTNAGYFLFSSKEPTVLKMAVYATDERINFLDINRVHDNIYNLIDIATVYINQHMNWRVEFDGKSTSRIEIPEVPVNAIREIVVNAIVHNDWSITEPQVSFFKDRIEILSHGGLPHTLSIDEFYRGISKPRNVRLMKIFSDLDIVDHTGHGVPIIIEKYGREAFDISDNHIIVTIPFNQEVVN